MAHQNRTGRALDERVTGLLCSEEEKCLPTTKHHVTRRESAIGGQFGGSYLAFFY